MTEPLLGIHDLRVDVGPATAVHGIDLDIARAEARRLVAIPGNVPEPWNLPPGCAFAPRCPEAFADCDHAVPALPTAGAAHRAACLRVAVPAERIPA